MKAFTLIELTIYLALLSLLMLGSVSLAYSVSVTNESDAEAARITEDGAFVLQKIAWAINQATDIDITKSELRIRTADAVTDAISVRYESGSLYMRVGTEDYSLIATGIETIQFEVSSGALRTAYTLRGRYFSSVHDIPYD